MKVIVPPSNYLTGSLKLKGKGVTIEGSASWSYRGVGGSILTLVGGNPTKVIKKLNE